MRQPLYLEDCYQKEFDSTIIAVKDGKFVVLEDTAFYPNSGGQPNDTGILVRKSDRKEFSVVFVGKFEGVISHQMEDPNDPGAPTDLKEGDEVHCIIDWNRRYTLMRYHTAAHVLSRVLYDEAGANTSGNQLGLDQSRIDFTLDNLDRDKIQGWIDRANELISAGAPVKISEISREEAQKRFEGPSKHLMADLPVLRVIDIAGIDIQSCGGTHLKNISEIGKLELIKLENKGKNNRRIYFRLAEQDR